MATITFKNGRSVNFNGTPTEADINEVAQKIGIQPDQSPSFLNKAARFGKDLYTNVVGGPVTMMTRPGELAGVGIAKLASDITGNGDYYNRALDASNQKMTTPLGTSLPPISDEEKSPSLIPGPVKLPEKTIGEGISTVALGVPNATLAGAGAGVGNAMQNNGSPLNVGVQGLIGGVSGYGLSKALGLISKLVNPQGDIGRSLISSGLSDEVQAPTEANLLHETGIRDLSNAHQVAVGQNLLKNEADFLSQKIATQVPDSISGQFSDGAIGLQNRLGLVSTVLDKLNRLTQMAPETPGLLSRLAGNTVRSGANFFGKALPLAAGLGAGGYLLKNMFAGSPLLDKANGQ